MCGVRASSPLIGSSRGGAHLHAVHHLSDPSHLSGDSLGERFLVRGLDVAGENDPGVAAHDAEAGQGRASLRGEAGPPPPPPAGGPPRGARRGAAPGRAPPRERRGGPRPPAPPPPPP